MNLEAVKEKLALTKEQLAEIIKEESSFIKENGLKRFIPHVIVIVYNTENNKQEEIVIGLSCNLGSDDEKELIMKSIANMLVEKHNVPICTVLVTEAWMVTRTDLTDKNRPSEDPNREEIIHVSALTFLGLTATTFAKIDHNLDYIDDFSDIGISHWTDQGGAKPFLIRKLYAEFMNKIRMNIEEEKKKFNTDPSKN